MVKKKRDENAPIYQIKITLRHFSPPIWRRFLAPSDMTLAQLHDLLQIVMGWTDSHLHQFDIGGIQYGVPAIDDYMPTQDERKVRLQQIVPGEKFKFRYEYDFGDSWDHDVVIEKVLPPDPDQQLPVCIKGKRACPPEDVGGVWGYAHFLEAIHDVNHPEHEDMQAWVGDEFDPETFDIDEVNVMLHKFMKV